MLMEHSTTCVFWYLSKDLSCQHDVAKYYHNQGTPIVWIILEQASLCVTNDVILEIDAEQLLSIKVLQGTPPFSEEVAIDGTGFWRLHLCFY